MIGFIERIQNCLAESKTNGIPWKIIDQLFTSTCYSEMKTAQQNPIFHAEGDVYIHTQMVCWELIQMREFQKLPDKQKTELFLAALLHDIGKVKTNRVENGNWVSPHHASVGSQIVRAFLWRDCELCGTEEAMITRETVCALIRFHMLPVHLMNQENPERKVREVADIGRLAMDFSWHLLCMLAEADVQGRIADDIDDCLVHVEETRLIAEEAGCLHKPYCFADNHTKHAYLSGRNVQPTQTLFDDTWGEVVMLSGLPGTGKDTWIRQNHPDKPVVSLDDIRRELRIKPTDNQGEVIQTAQGQAREYLREKQPFVWNATDLTKDTRQKLVRLFEGYGARVRIVYLETDWEARKKRNMDRSDAVPEKVITGLLRKAVPPTPDEAVIVEWLCV